MKNFQAKTNERLSHLLLREYGGELSYARLQTLFRKKDIKVNGARVSKDVLLKIGDEICVYFDGVKFQFDYHTIFSDENVLVIDKPKGISSELFFERLKAAQGELYFCHRLDTNTDGVMIFARNNSAEAELLDGFKRRTFKKEYVALVFGEFKEKEATLTAFLKKDAEKGKVTIIDKPERGAVKIVTKYRVLSSNDGYSKVSVELVTGRTHQIRAHLAHIGHFVLGDGKYGVDSISKGLGFNEMQLTAQKLTLYFEETSALLSDLNGKEFCSENKMA